jgi:ribosomal protein S27AE
MRRAIKLVFHEHRITCPYCATALIYHLTTEAIQLAERTCLKCGKGFVIENNIAKRLPSKKRPQKV